MTWIAAKLFLQGIPLHVWAILAAVVLLAAGWAYERHQYGDRRADAVQAQWDAKEAEYALQRAEAAIAARNTEARHRAEYAAIAARFLQEQADAKIQTDRVIAGLRDGSVRVRRRFTCPGLPGAAADSSGAAETGPRGFQPADAEAALGIAARADAVARQLNALLEAVKAGQR